MGVCLPITIKGKVMGATCVDITLNDLLRNVINTRASRDVYAFIINKEGRCLIHPLLPKPNDVISSLLVHIDSLESGSDVKAITESMRSGASGERSVRTTIIHSGGYVRKDGVIKNKVLATFAYGKVEKEHFNPIIFK